MIVRTALGNVGVTKAGGGSPAVPVYLLHGYPMHRAMWKEQLAIVPPDVELVALDLPGFGESERLANPSLDHWADWVVAAADALGHERFVVCGLSLGGYVTLAVWRRHRARVQGLILADTRPGADSDEAKAKRLEMKDVATAEGAAGIADRMLPGLVGKTTRASRPGVMTVLADMMREGSVPAIHDALDVMRTRPDQTDVLATITVPTLIVCGEEDVVTPLKESQSMQAAVRGSSLVVVPQAGHVSNLESPAAFNAAMAAFLAAL